MTITNEQLNLFTQIYSVLSTISTKGEDTIKMAECLQALGQTLQTLQESAQQSVEQEKNEE